MLEAFEEGNKLAVGLGAEVSFSGLWCPGHGCVWLSICIGVSSVLVVVLEDVVHLGCALRGSLLELVPKWAQGRFILQKENL
jgi:hypothetical protein